MVYQRTPNKLDPRIQPQIHLQEIETSFTGKPAFKPHLAVSYCGLIERQSYEKLMSEKFPDAIQHITHTQTISVPQRRFMLAFKMFTAIKEVL